MRTEPATLDIEQILAVTQLPALPQTAIRLLQISQDVDAGPADFAAPIESDLGLASQVLRFVNSSYFGFSHEVASVRHAVALVGMRTIKNFVLWNAVFSQMPDPKCCGFRLKQLWEDSLRRALFARALCARFRFSAADDAFTAALLQDMAIPLLAKGSPARYIRLFEGRHDGRTRLSAMEHELFGWTHAEAAKRIAQHWSLPEHFAVAVGSHLEIDQLAAIGMSRPIELAVAMSALLPSGADQLWMECAVLDDCYQRMVPADDPALPVLLGQVDGEFHELAPLLKVNGPGMSLVGTYEKAMSTQDAVPR